jgi:hypothetical protein
MKTMMNNVISPLFKKTAYALGIFSLLTALTSAEAKANRIDSNGHCILGRSMDPRCFGMYAR